MFGALDLSWPELAVCCAAALGGGAVQAVLGFGYALLVVPALLVVAPGAVPAAALVVAMPMVVLLAVLDLDEVEWTTAARLTAGRLPGTVVGAVVLGTASPTAVAGAAGAFLLLAVAASVVRGVQRASPRLELGAGFVSGVAGTVGAVGGPYLGLVVADRPGPVLRATVSVAFACGLVLSLAAVALTGELTTATAGLGLALVPATLLGVPLGRRFAGRLHGGRLRAAVLSVAGAAGGFALVRALISASGT